MTMPNSLSKATRTRLGGSSHPDAKPTESGTEKRLGDLIRDEDRRLTTIDPSQELRRRACPSGE
jgi:hypothetical protein